MKARVVDPLVLRALKPLDLVAYLRVNGWHKATDIDNRASVWAKAQVQNDEPDITLPLKDTFGDYALRIGEILRTLSEIEKRSELEIIRDISTATSDTIRIRARGQSTDDGTLPLEDAVTFVERSRDMLLSAACAAIEKRSFFAKRKPQRAMEYLREVRMGQTEHGSYVLTIHSPVPPELKPNQDDLFYSEISEPYERQVTMTLTSALAALERATSRAAMNGDMRPFNEAVAIGVSANLCDSVIGLANVSQNATLDIHVSWSRTRPITSDTPTRIVLGRDAMPIIEEAARHFRDTAPIEDFDLEGFVTRLDRGPTAVEGEITVEGIVDDHMRRITMRLGPNNYKHAVKAHEYRLKIKCTGELVKQGRGFKLENPRHFEFDQNDDSSPQVEFN